MHFVTTGKCFKLDNKIFILKLTKVVILEMGFRDTFYNCSSQSVARMLGCYQKSTICGQLSLASVAGPPDFSGFRALSLRVPVLVRDGVEQRYNADLTVPKVRLRIPMPDTL